ncbi:MAG: DUF896 domain-containing protein [Eubacterium sp.]|jgi:Uncharacterized protein conserved in bacteria|nr:DUF896 domain-containing protein [Eubacterium sp.]MCI9411733.1 DUF896 domain-containing protein [Eubacterium sp.]
MDENKIQRINELYKKKKEGTITEEELAEQALLRAEYIESVRKNLRSTLSNVSIQEKDGSITPLTKKQKH